MTHKPITFEAFLELYIKAHYFRPDGEDRNWEEYGDTEDNRDLIARAKETGLMVTGFSFNYFRGLSEFPLLDLKTTITLDMPHTLTNAHYIMEFLDLSEGECSPHFDIPPQASKLSLIITEQY